jgi:two-component system OmpR family sensor kinase
MAVVLGVIGVFFYLRFQTELDSTIDSGLRLRAGDVATLVRSAGPELGKGATRLVGRSESFAEVLDSGGRVVDSSVEVGQRVLLTPAELARAKREAITVTREPGGGLEDKSRLLAEPVEAGRRDYVVVVGASVEARDDSLVDLLQLLLVGGPLALLLASFTAYWVAGAALAPVDRMRARAAEISAAEPDARLPVPSSGDEVARLGETLNEMLVRLAEALEHERAFVADASHELRTPLAILRAELELALKKGRSVEELRAALASASEESDRLIQLSEDLLTIAQTEGGELPLRRTRVELGELLGGVERRFAARAAEAGRGIEVVAPAAPALAADRMRLEQALGNMVDNSLRYGAGEVRIEVRKEGGTVEIHVLDRGPGLPAEFRERAFERFSRAAPSRRDGGSGLGLSIVRTIALAHGGEAHAEGREGGGADVWLSLPLSSAV